MNNKQTVTLVVTVDVDRGSKYYSQLAARALDPTQTPSEGIGQQTLVETDVEISKIIAASAVTRLVAASSPMLLGSAYGETRIRMRSRDEVFNIPDLIIASTEKEE